MIVTETGGVLPTAKELGLDSETEDDDSDDDRDKRDDEVASDHDADDITLPRAVTVDRADSAETDQEDRSGKPDGMRACDWRLEQEFPADALRWEHAVSATRERQRWVRNRHQPGKTRSICSPLLMMIDYVKGIASKTSKTKNLNRGGGTRPDQ